MKEIKCTCGCEMDFLDTIEVDTNIQDMTMWIVEAWECENCQTIQKFSFEGQIKKVEKY